MKTLKTGREILSDGRACMIYEMETDNGLAMHLTNYGGIIMSMRMSGRDGKMEHITAGFPTVREYLKPNPYFGAIVGRFANRIAGAAFQIDDTIFPLQNNNGYCQLHGGAGGFHTRLWDSESFAGSGFTGVRLSLLSPDLDQGYPGNLSALVTYTLSDDNTLTIDYEATSDRPTHVNLTNHSYFNLSGFREDIGSHYLLMNALYYLELDEHQLPTGRLLPCEGSVFDFREGVKLSDRGIPSRHELDYCFVPENGTTAQEKAILYHERSGRRMSVYTTQPGIQVYSANYFDGSIRGHENTVYSRHLALCFETQHFPDTPNQKSFPPTLLMPGETYSQKAVFRFETLHQ